MVYILNLNFICVVVFILGLIFPFHLFFFILFSHIPGNNFSTLVLFIYFLTSQAFHF